MKIALFSLVILGMLNGPVASSWERVEIPDTRCGDGSPYAVFLHRRDPAKLMLYFEGGGACWDLLTCRGPVPLAPLGPAERMRHKGGILSSDPDKSPVPTHSVVYFPYCTGDVYVGSHVADYGLGVRVNHWGRRNVERTVEYLASRRGIPFSTARELVVYGQSAGAIGAVYHISTIEPYLPAHQKRTVILDSPGFQYPAGFFRRFSPAMLGDFRYAIERMGVPFDPNDGNLARHAGEVCARFPEWKVAVLQGSRDIVMSLIFSQMSPFAYEDKVYGPLGIYEATLNPLDNCSAWVPRTFMHTFLIRDWSARIKAGEITALDFVRDVLAGRGGLNYRDP